MKPIIRCVLLATVVVAAQPVLAYDADYDSDRSNYYNSQHVTDENGQPVNAADAKEQRRMHHHWREKHEARCNDIRNDVANGGDNDANNRGRHSYIFGDGDFREGTSHVVKH